MPNRVLTAACLVAASALPCSAQSLGTSAFVTTLGRDTFAVERFTRTTDRVVGAVLTPYPRALRVTYEAQYDAQRHIKRFDLKAYRLTGQPEMVVHRAITIDDSVVTTEVTRFGKRDDTLSGRQIVRRGAFPWIQNSNAFQEEMARLLRDSRVDSLSVDQFIPGPQGVFANAVKRIGVDSMLTDFGGTPVVYRLDEQGRILSADAGRTTVRTRTERVRDVDMNAVAAAFAAREKANGVAGQLSPRDTARARIATADLSVDYGRPAARGRRIFGALVPWDSVWRAGANAATQLSTSADLTFGSSTIPAGRYTLWIIPRSESSATLIINKQTGQWGTQYDSTQDLVRIPLTVQPTAAPVEKFAIAIDSAGNGGVLRISWERTAYVAPFTVKGPS